MPEKFHSILRSYYDCKSSQETYHWDEGAAQQIIQHAIPLRPEEGSYFSDRAYCPLCGDGSQSPYESGFSLPEGLRRHLVGYGRAHQCSVMDAVLKLARDHWHEKFHASDEAERAQARAVLEDRRNSETLYRLAPSDKPVLLDEGLTYSWRPARDDNELSWAETRLAALGFKVLMEGRIKAYVKEHGEFVVYADPRPKGEIVFSLHMTGPKTKKRPRWIRPTFSIRDAWKNDLHDKYENRCSQAIKQLQGSKG